jgi:plasmid stabilization system protein ParE
MKRTPKPRLALTNQANRDLDRCRLFLQRIGASHPRRRIREIREAAWRLRDSPKLYPVEEVHSVSGLELRRKNVGRFVIIYAFLEPTPSLPGGEVSIGRVRHAAEEDVLFRVEERRGCGVTPTHGLSTRQYFDPPRY